MWKAYKILGFDSNHNKLVTFDFSGAKYKSGGKGDLCCCYCCCCWKIEVEKVATSIVGKLFDVLQGAVVAAGGRDHGTTCAIITSIILAAIIHPKQQHYIRCATVSIPSKQDSIALLVVTEATISAILSPPTNKSVGAPTEAKSFSEVAEAAAVAV